MKNKTKYRYIILLILIFPIFLRIEFLFNNNFYFTVMENSLFTSMLMWFFMVLCIYYFKLKEIYIFFGSALIIFLFSLENLNFGNLIQDYYDTDIYDFQEPVWLEMLNQRTSLNWNQRIGGGHRLVGQMPREYIVFKLISMNMFDSFNSYNLYVLFHYILSGCILLQVSKKLEFDKYVSVIFAYTVLSAESLSLWYSFIHWPAFVIGMTLFIYSLFFENYKKLLIIAIASYCLATSAHLQLYLMIYIYIGVYFVVELFFIKNVKKFFKNLVFLFLASVTNFVYLFYFFETLFISDRVFVGESINIPKLDLVTLATFFDPFYSYPKFWLILNNNLYITPLLFFSVFILRNNDIKIKIIFYSSLITGFLFSKLNFFSEIFQEIIFIKYVSNWERFSALLIFTIAILIFAGINKYLELSHFKNSYLIILFIVVSLFSTLERQSVRSQIQLSFPNNIENEFSSLLDLTDEKYRITGVCFSTSISDLEAQYFYRPNRFLIYNNYSRWFDIYDSWVTKGYKEFYKRLTEESFTGISYGGGWFHTKENRKYNLQLAKTANIGYILSPKDQNCFETSGLKLLGTSQSLDLYQIPDTKERYYFSNNYFETAELNDVSENFYAGFIYYIIENGVNSIERFGETQYQQSNESVFWKIIKQPSEIAESIDEDGANVLILNNSKRYGLFENYNNFYSAGSAEEFMALSDLGYNKIGYKHPVFLNFLRNNSVDFTPSSLDDGVYLSDDFYRTEMVDEFLESKHTHEATQVEVISEVIQNGYFNIELNSQEETLMIINETWDPGWKVLINGYEKEIFIANRAFMGVFLEKGYSSIELVYENFNLQRVPEALMNFFGQ